jgi:hypothetical protein
MNTTFAALRFKSQSNDQVERRKSAVALLGKQGFAFPITLTFPYDLPITLRSAAELPTETTLTPSRVSYLVEWV